MNAADIRRLFRTLRATFDRQRDHLGNLDATLGDGDHGAGMARGFATVEEATASLTTPDVGQVLQAAGRALMSGMGGASGALFASLFLEIGKSSVGANTLESRHLAEGSRAALATIRRLGKTRTGDKTMLDALTPAASTLEANASGNLALALARAAEAARGGAEATKGMAARRGRAQYVPQAGLGHLDPGAVSVLLIFETWRDAARSEERKL